MVSNSTNINKRTITSHRNSLNTKKTTRYDVRNPGLAWDRHKNITGLNRLMRSQSSLLDNWISNSNTYIHKTTIKTSTDPLPLKKTTYNRSPMARTRWDCQNVFEPPKFLNFREKTNPVLTLDSFITL